MMEIKIGRHPEYNARQVFQCTNFLKNVVSICLHNYLGSTWWF